MGKKRNVLLYMDDETVNKAKKIGINLSQFCENSLKYGTCVIRGILDAIRGRSINCERLFC